jgi:hypothetical protein
METRIAGSGIPRNLLVKALIPARAGGKAPMLLREAPPEPYPIPARDRALPLSLHAGKGEASSLNQPAALVRWE